MPASDYAKMKNADLEALLKTRGLPTGGKKADMVERLTKDDEKAAAPATADTAEDEIDWDDDAPEPTKSATEAAAQATTEPAAAAIKAGGQGQVANPQAVPNQVVDTDPSKTADLSVKPSTTTDIDANGETKVEEPKPEEPPVDFSKGLAASNLDIEIEKRKARAKKFGTSVEDDEGLKKLERMKKFGETGPPKGLDEALPERTRKRGRDGGEEDGGQHKRRGGRFGGRRGRGNRPRDNRREEKSAPTGAGTWMSEGDRAKAEARRNRFTTST